MMEGGGVGGLCSMLYRVGKALDSALVNRGEVQMCDGQR